MLACRFKNHTNFTLVLNCDNTIMGYSYLIDVMTTLDSVTDVFEHTYKNFNQYSCTIINDPSYSNPWINKSDGIIFLSVPTISDGNYNREYNKYVYQYAHELCHHIIKDDVPQNLRWFEESLCEMSSYFFLYKLTEAWEQNPPHENWRDYARYFGEFAFNLSSMACKFDIHEIKAIYNPLSTNEYQRDINKVIANALLPIFQNNPSLWNSIIFLSKIPNNLPLYDSLCFWKKIVPEEYAQDIQKIIDTF